MLRKRYVILSLMLVLDAAKADVTKGVELDAGSVVHMSDFQVAIPALAGTDGMPVKRWKQYIDSDNKNKLILVTGTAFDMHFRPYSVYTITGEPFTLELPLTQQTVVEHINKKYTWKNVPVVQKQDKDFVCLGENNGNYNFDDGFIYGYQSVCFNFKTQKGTKFLMSTVKLYKGEVGFVARESLGNKDIQPIQKEFADFAVDLVKSYRPSL